MNERDLRDQMANTNGLSNEQLLSELEKRAADAENRLSVLESGNEGLWLCPSSSRTSCACTLLDYNVF